MSTIPTLPGITSHMIRTPRLDVHALTSGPDDGAPVLFIHGNGASATFWEHAFIGRWSVNGKR
jgi:pimeloyl-ACP methyl ester carboxylesterase